MTLTRLTATHPVAGLGPDVDPAAVAAAGLDAFTTWTAIHHLTADRPAVAAVRWDDHAGVWQVDLTTGAPT